MGAAPLRALIGWVLVALTLLSAGCDRLGRPASSAVISGQPLAPTAPRGALQEVAPPPMVQQLRAHLDRHDPQLSILAPADGALLPAGPWTLELQVQDWPLVDAGPLGLGPHLVVQLDDEPPLQISDPAAARHLTMAPLSPGSHRLTVVAARPWGEVVKAPGASRQIRLDRVAANLQQVPAPGSPQLLAALASPEAGSEPVLIDWLLLDAPLQHLKDDDGRWRLRVSVNGDSFLVDRQTPLWLKGFHGGSNAVQLELLDGRGEPLNPPFNSLVEEVVIQPGRSAAWQRPSLTAQEQAQILGEAPLAPEPRAEVNPDPLQKASEPRSDLQAKPSADLPPAPAGDSVTVHVTDSSPDLLARAQASPTDQATPLSGASISEPAQGAQPGSPAPATAAAIDATLPAPGPDPAQAKLANPVVELSANPAIELSANPAVELSANPAIELPANPAADQPRTPLKAADDPEPTPNPENPLARTPSNGVQTAPAIPASAAGPGSSLAADEANVAATPTAPPPGRLSASTRLSGRARDQVAADGSLLKPRPEGPLARLRQRFQP